MFVEDRPRWHHSKECESCTAETDVECIVDVLSDEASEECKDLDVC